MMKFEEWVAAQPEGSEVRLMAAKLATLTPGGDLWDELDNRLSVMYGNYVDATEIAERTTAHQNVGKLRRLIAWAFGWLRA